MKAVHILLRINSPDHPVLIHMRRKRKLNQNAVDGRIRIQLIHLCKELLFGCRFRQQDFFVDDAAFLAGTNLIAHINLTRRILTDQNHRKGYGNSLVSKSCNLLLQLRPYVCRNFLPVYDLC